MQTLTRVNAVLALVLELALLVALVATGLSVPAATPVRVALAVLLPAAVIAVWARWVAPRASRRLDARGRLLVQTGLFALAVVALAAVGAVGGAVVLAVLAAARVWLGLRVGQV